MKILIYAASVIISILFHTIFITTDSKNTFSFSYDKKNEIHLIGHFDTLSSADTVCLKGLPPIGKWMLQGNKQRANWLGVLWKNKTLIEPINIILIDSISSTPEQSEKFLIDNLKKAGYTSRNLHSSGYLGYIGGAYYNQYPKENNHAFSNASAFVDNNHGRIFGPHFYHGAYYYTAALSRENVAPFSKVKHHFASFVKARDAFAFHLNKKSKYKIIKKVGMHNMIQKNSAESTGDHDGMAIVLSLKK